MSKPVGETKAIRIYGPYPDKRNPDKWMLRVIDDASGIDKKVIVWGTDTHALHSTIRRCVKKGIARRSKD